MGYLLPYDTDEESLYVTAIPMNEFNEFSTMSNSKHLLFLLDACYGGLAASTSRGLSVEAPDYIEKITRDKSRQIITAGARGEQVVEKAASRSEEFELKEKAMDNILKLVSMQDMTKLSRD